MKQSLVRCESLEMELGVDNKFFAMIARGEQQQRLFQTFSQQGTSDFLVATVAKWDEHERILVIHEQKATRGQPSCRSYKRKARVPCGCDGKENIFQAPMVNRL